MARSFKSRRRISEDNHLKILLPSEAVADLFQNNFWSVFQTNYNALISISNEQDFFPGTDCRVCLLSGTETSILRSNFDIMEKMSNMLMLKADDDGVVSLSRKFSERILMLKIIVPKISVAKIIGSHGQYIDKIKELSNCFIEICPLLPEVDVWERCVTISGELAGKNIALRMILRAIYLDTNEDYYLNISYVNVTNMASKPIYRPIVLTRNLNFESLRPGMMDSNFLPSDVNTSRKLDRAIREVKKNLTKFFSKKALYNAAEVLNALRKGGLLEVAFVILMENNFPSILEMTDVLRNINVDKCAAHIPQQNQAAGSSSQLSTSSAVSSSTGANFNGIYTVRDGSDGANDLSSPWNYNPGQSSHLINIPVSPTALPLDSPTTTGADFQDRRQDFNATASDPKFKFFNIFNRDFL